MAEEKDEATEEEEVVEEVPKKGNLKLIIILALALAVLGGGGTFLWFKVIAPAIGVVDETDGKEGKKEKPERMEMTTGPMYPLDSFIVNLAGEGGKRFLKLTMELEVNDEKLSEEITASLPKIKDSILILLSSKTFEDIYTVAGKFKLRDEITARINSFLATGHLRNVYFTEFVIQ